MHNKISLSTNRKNELLSIVKDRFEKNKQRHPDIDWLNVEAKLLANPDKLWSLNEMEITEGAPDVVAYDESTSEYIFYDCSAESPKGRRSFCYDDDALNSRKEHKPKNSAVGMARQMGVSLLTEQEYRHLQQLGEFDTKTSSWLASPTRIRDLRGAIFGDRRYDEVFIYHNGAESYYAARGFRTVLKV